MRDRIKREGWLSSPELEFVDEHYSGKNLERPGMMRLRERIRRKEIDAVIIYTPDRLSRRMAHQLIFLEECQKHNVRIVFVQATFDDTPEGRMMFNMLGCISEFEREKIHERTSRGRRQKAEEGHITSHVAPYGFAYVPGDKQNRVPGRWVLCDQELPGARRIFELAAEGIHSYRGICCRLTEEGIRPRTAAQWKPQVVTAILSNTAYKGQARMNRLRAVEPLTRRNPDARASRNAVRPREEWKLVDVPAIVSPELWQQANDRMAGSHKRHAGRPTRHYLLSGHLWCSVCGRRCGALPNHGRPIYGCLSRNRLTLERLCRVRKTIRASRIEGVVWDAVMSVLTDPATFAAVIDECREPGEQQNERAQKLYSDIAKQEKVILRAEREFFDPEISDTDSFRAGLKQARQRKRELEAELATLAPKAIPTISMKDLKRVCALYEKYKDSLDFDFKREMLKEAGIRVIFFAEEQAIEITGEIDFAPPCGKRQSGQRETPVFDSVAIPFKIKRSLAAAA